MNRKTLLLSAVPLSLLFVMRCATSSANDFEYIANPPHVLATSAKVLPKPAGSGAYCQPVPGLPDPGLCGYVPSVIQQAYDFPATLDGSGQTIVIVDAYGSPTIRNDLAIFDSAFGIPAPPSFTIVCSPSGCPTFHVNSSKQSSNQVGWSLETSLDVEYAHAMAPGANIVLVVASSSYGDAINAAETKAIASYPGSVMSQSFGIPEYLVSANDGQFLQAARNYQAAEAAGITVLASAGDSGATNGAGFANAGFPASDPLVTAVGGTEGLPFPDGLTTCSASGCSYGGEQVWNENEPAIGLVAATGGAPSLFFPAPSYQAALGLGVRTTPDVAYNAAVNGGVFVYWGSVPSGAGFYFVGGTSAASPQWAAIIALANQLSAEEGYGPLGFVNPGLYQLAQTSAYASDFHDITTGNNQLAGTPVGFSAAAGWDDASGWGTPDVSKLVPDLVACVKTTSCP